MKELKQITAVLLSVILMTTLLFGCGGGKSEKKEAPGAAKASAAEENLNSSGFPVVKTPITLRALSAKNSVHADWNTMLVWQEYEKKTGIKMQWDLVPQENFTERKNVLLASGDLPDVFYRGMLTPDDESNYGSQGVFLDLQPLIDKYAPNIKRMFEAHPEYKKTMAQIDGKIYSLGQVIDYPAPRVNKGWINTKWLQKTGLQMPESTDAYYGVLKAMKEVDYNGNGKKDEIPLSGNKEWVIQMFNVLGGAWGLGTTGRAAAEANVDLGPDGKLRFIATDANYKEMLQYLNRLWAEGLMDKEIFTQNASQFMAKGDENIVGSWLEQNNPSIIGKNYADYVTMPAFKGPGGDRIWGAIGPAAAAGAFAITNKNKYPEASIRWVDYFYSEEGVRLLRMGVEGVTYRALQNGEVEFVEDITKNPKGLTMDQAVGQFTVTPGGAIPQIMMQKYDKGHTGSPVVVQGAKLLEPYIVKDIWSLKFSKSEQQRLSALNTDINTYVNEMRVKFITGVEPFGSWDGYVNKIKQMGVDELLSIWSAAYERWKK